MSSLSSKKTHLEGDKQLRNFLTLKAKVIHTDELICRYREKGQECNSLQGQLQQTLAQEASLKQSMVGLRAEVEALVAEKKTLQETVAASRWEKEVAEGRATNSEMVVQQLTAQLDTQSKRENCLRDERDKLAEQCSQLQDQLKKALQWSLSGRRRRHHSFSSLSLPTSPPLASRFNPFSLPAELPCPGMEGSGCRDQNPLRCSGLDLSISDTSSEGEGEREGDRMSTQSQPISSSPQQVSPAPYSPLVHAAADTMISDTDSDLSLSEVESLSPIPPSPHLRLPTLSPLPLSPAGQTLSPLPLSPAGQTLSPLPLSPAGQTLSPLPSPPPTHSLPQFVSTMQNACCAPVPSVCVTSSPPPIISPSLTTQSTLHLSHLSPFSATNLHSLTTSTSLEQPVVSTGNISNSSPVMQPLSSSPSTSALVHPTPADSEREEVEVGQLEEGELDESELGEGELGEGGLGEGGLGEGELGEGGLGEGGLGEGGLGESELGEGGLGEGGLGEGGLGEGELGEGELGEGGLGEGGLDEGGLGEGGLGEGGLGEGGLGEGELGEGGLVEEKENTHLVQSSPSEECVTKSSPDVCVTEGPADCGVPLFRECVQKRRPSDQPAGPRLKLPRLATDEVGHGAHTIAGEREQGGHTDEGGGDGAREESGGGESVAGEGDGAEGSRSTLAVEAVAIQNVTPKPAARVGYAPQSSTAVSSNVLLTDGATGQVEELPSPTSSLPSLGELLAEPPSEAAPSSSPGPADPSLAPSLLQQSLCTDLLCPLPLPDWLLTAMLRVQSMREHTAHSFKRKKGYFSGRRQPKQKSHSYAANVVERLVCGQIPLATAVKLFSDPWNCSNPSVLSQSLVNYLKSCYLPRINHVITTYNTLCSDVKSKALECPSSQSFPPALLRPECQLIALLYHCSKMNCSMAQLLPEVASALYSAALSPLLTFHRLAAIARLFAAVCRLLGQPDRILFLSSDLLRRPLSFPELPVIIGMAGVWPAVFSRRHEVEVVVGGRLNPAGVEAQPLSYGLEVVVTAMLRQGGSSEHHITRLHTLCLWGTGQTITVKTVEKLAIVLLQLLQTSRRVNVEQQSCQGWFRPRPSPLTFQLVHTLRLLSWFKGWVWTSDVLIKAHLWPILQAWNSKRESVPEATVMAVVRLLGFIGQQCTESSSSALDQLKKVLLSLLVRQETPLSVQLCAAESLIDLCPPVLPSSREAVGVIWKWLRGLARHPAGPHLSREFIPKLSTAPPHLLHQRPSPSLLPPTNSSSD